MNGLGRNFGLGLVLVLVGLVSLGIVFTSFERPPVLAIQQGFRGTGMELVYNPREVTAQVAAFRLPQAPEPADTDGPRASEIFENVRVLGDLSAAQFGRIMQAMTEWVSPEGTVENGGCNYCHVPGNFAAEGVYTKDVSRRMLQMVKHINAAWQSHVGQTGVTCYTCHRGQPVPAAVWARVPEARTQGLAETATGQNIAAQQVGLSSLPFDPFTPFLLQDRPISVISRTPLPAGNLSSIKQTEWTYALMFHMAGSLGVNCTHCHNSRSFFDWDQSSPQRTSAWYAIRMVRDVNQSYIEPLQPIFPAHRLGPLGDPLKANCATCHQGAAKPLYGAPMLRDYPELNAVRDSTTRAAAVAPR
jgi:photosynthetic reaction center cytochrome c subunit